MGSNHGGKNVRLERVVLGVVVALMTGGNTVAALLGLFGDQPSAHQPPATSSTSKVVPLSPGSSNDALFLRLLAGAGTVITDPGEAIASGHRICGLLTQDDTAAQAAADVSAPPEYSLDNRKAFVSAAVGAYCPRYRTQTHGSHG